MECAQDIYISLKLGLICKPCIEVRASQEHDIVVGIIVHDIMSTLHIIGCIIDVHNFVLIHPIMLQNDGVSINRVRTDYKNKVLTHSVEYESVIP